MNLVDASYKILRLDKERDIEMIARGYCVCYNTALPNTYEKQCEFIRKHRNHESPLEHSIMTVGFTINRSVSHELVRHRHCGYSQQSTRYCNYSNERFGSELTFIKDIHIENSAAYSDWYFGRVSDEANYFKMLDLGLKPEEARGGLPNDIKTELIISTNFREWRSIFKTRCDSHAHYQMREVMQPLLDEMKKELPCIFDDISY